MSTTNNSPSHQSRLSISVWTNVLNNSLSPYKFISKIRNTLARTTNSTSSKPVSETEQEQQQQQQTDDSDAFTVIEDDATISKQDQDHPSYGTRSRKRARISKDDNVLNNNSNNHNTEDNRIHTRNHNKHNKRTPEKEITQSLCKKSENFTDTFYLSTLKEGDRTAFDFGKDIYFGYIKKCHINEKDKRRWTWDVEFDDGEIYEYSRNDMLKGIVLYQDFKEREMNDPTTEKRKRKMKDDFLTKKRSVLLKIPHKVKSQFLQVGFALWLGKYRPVLFLGPYDVMPGKVRDRWFREFEKLQKEHDNRVPWIVYWFGEKRFRNAFSILTKDCVTYEMGIKLKLDIKCRTKDEQSYNEMMEVILKPPHERRPFPEFMEDYEYVIGPKADRLLVEMETECRQRATY